MKLLQQLSYDSIIVDIYLCLSFGTAYAAEVDLINSCQYPRQRDKSPRIQRMMVQNAGGLVWTPRFQRLDKV